MQSGSDTRGLLHNLAALGYIFDVFQVARQTLVLSGGARQ
jgi:hypothetical protein